MVYLSQLYWGIVQLVERKILVLDVGGSSPPAPANHKGAFEHLFFLYPFICRAVRSFLIESEQTHKDTPMIHREILVRAKKRRQEIAIIDTATGRELTYGDLIKASYVLAGKFARYKEEYVGVMMPTTFAAMVVNLGVHLAGKIPVMINFSTGIENNIAFAREKCGLKKVVTVTKLYENRKDRDLLYVDELVSSLSATEKVKLLIRGKLRSMQVKGGENPEDTAVVLFTSGSEKTPKAVQLSHKGLLANALGAIDRFEFTQDDRLVCLLPLFHVFGYNVNFVLPLLLGGTSITLPSPLEYQKVVTAIKEHRGTVFAGTPVFLHGYLRKAHKGDFNSVRLVVAGADKLPRSLVDGYRESHGVTVVEGYGTTETSPVISANTLKENRFGSIGKPFPGVEVKIVDVDTGEILSTGESGKVLVRGDLVMKGYLGDIEETYKSMRNGWYDTGDMGHVDSEGYLWHDGRLKRFAKIGGEMVSLVMVENELAKILGEEHQCCVVDLPDKIKGARIVAAITHGVEIASVKREMKKVLPPISLPKEYLFFKELPLLGNGKIDFREVQHNCYELSKQNKKA